MELPAALSPPKWVTKPNQLEQALSHDAFYGPDFENSVSVPDTAKFAAGCRQFLYWKRQLAPSLTDFTVMFALLSSAGISALNVLNVMSGALRAFCLQKAVEFSQGANSNFLAVSFRSAEDAATFRSQFKYHGECVVSYVQPMSTRTYRYSLLWLPPLFGIGRVRSFLKKYSTVFTTIKGSMSLGDGKYIPSSVIRGTITLNEGVELSDLPNLIPLPSPHQGHALLIIDGRDPFCLKCLSSGHLRKNCDRPRCSVCRFHHFPSDVCERSTYASKVAKSSGCHDSYCWTDDVGEITDAEVLPADGDAQPVIASSLIPLSVSPLLPPAATIDTGSESVASSPFSDGLSSISVILPSFPDSLSDGGDLSHPECDRTLVEISDLSSHVTDIEVSSASLSTVLDITPPLLTGDGISQSSGDASFDMGDLSGGDILLPSSTDISFNVIGPSVLDLPVGVKRMKPDDSDSCGADRSPSPTPPRSSSRNRGRSVGNTMSAVAGASKRSRHRKSNDSSTKSVKQK